MNEALEKTTNKSLSRSEAGMKAIAEILDRGIGQVVRALPYPSTMAMEQRQRLAERLIMQVREQIRNSEALALAAPESVYNSVMQVASLGLSLGGISPDVHLVAFGGVAKPMMDYRGLMKLARRDKRLIFLQAEAVYPGDIFEWEKGLSPKLVHKPIGDPEKTPTHYYAQGWYDNGIKYFEVMTDGQVEKIRLKSKSRDSDAWKYSRPEMGKKTVLKRLHKTLDRVDDFLDIAVALDNAQEDGRSVIIRNDTVVDVDPTTGEETLPKDPASAILAVTDPVEVVEEVFTEPPPETPKPKKEEKISDLEYIKKVQETHPGQVQELLNAYQIDHVNDADIEQLGKIAKQLRAEKR